MSNEAGAGDAKQCPWCARWALKDAACAFIFACGLDVHGVFHVGSGCGRSWCWECGKKYCGWYMNPADGRKCEIARETHAGCCELMPGFVAAEFCTGGHSSHCAPRTFEFKYDEVEPAPLVGKDWVSATKKREHIRSMQAIVSKATGEIVGVRFQVE